MQEDTPDAVDLQIVADSYRVVSDIGAWDTLIATWDRKISAAGYDDYKLAGEVHLQQHYLMLRSVLDKIGLPSARDPLDQAVGAVIEPAMAVSEKLRVVAINRMGREAFGVEQGQIVDLDWLHPSYRKSMREFVGSQTSRENQHYRIMKTQWRDGREGFAEVFWVAVPGIAGRYTAVRELTMRWPAQMDDVLVEAFGLTQAETEIARLLFTHIDVAKIAEIRNVSVRTARLQLSHIYAKTETSSQVELVRLLVLLATRLAEKSQNERIHWIDPLGRETVLIRPDGRRLAYTWMGAECGKPALFVPGVVNGYLYPEEFEATLKARGVKLYVLTRPGCGHSDPDPQLPALRDHADSIAYFCRALGLRGIAAASIHAAVIPLTEVAARPDNPFSSIVALGRFLHMTPQRFAKVAKLPRTLLWLAYNAPWAADVLGRHAWRALVQNDVDWYIQRAYGDMPFDSATTRRPEIAPLMRNACAYTFLQGPEIFFEDARLRRTDIAQYLRRIDIPFHWLLGAVDVYDRGRFYEANELAEVGALNPRLGIELVGGASELMPYQQPALVADRIADAAFGVQPTRTAEAPDTAR